MVDWIGGLVTFAEDPLVYLPLLFVYSVLATILLPIPVELGLLNPYLPPWVLVVVAAAGKATGGAFVFPLGTAVGQRIERWTGRFPRIERLYVGITGMVGRYGYAGLFALLAIPLMTDSIPVYAFAVLNPSEVSSRGAPSADRGASRRALRRGPFVAVNFGAALVRCSAFLAVSLFLGWP